MNKLTALCSFVLSLYGCDVGGSTYVTRTHVDGTDTLHSRTVVRAGVARFECLRSASGQCHYTVLPDACAPAPAAAGARSDHCTDQPLERFVLADGDSRQITGLPDFRLCVSADADTPRPDCQVAEALAAR
ncbi:MAG: hypothetical protein KY442_05500 [Proteobacteria bacterium]|nr:hypothetical protein [Pseudomonadota bacterium]